MNLQNAINAVTNTRNNLNSTQTDINNAVTLLLHAIEALELRPNQQEPEFPPINIPTTPSGSSGQTAPQGTPTPPPGGNDTDDDDANDADTDPDNNNATNDTNNANDPATPADTPTVLLRFEIGSYYYTNHLGQTLRGCAPPFITDNRAHVPLRIIAEALGATVTWDNATRTGYMYKDGITVSIVINQPLPDGLGTPVIINNRTFVPTRYISETFGAEVRWDNDNRAVYVYKPQ